ncbi:MAG: aminotransferase class V-fold PLP-dependent enzyme [Pseudanabaenaceae cyanobacterium bins.39]|nr:aminotransferase class V-fold PLP-dependent enzyme [Pseudanabaenaceae cyanobacterium bins.39]
MNQERIPLLEFAKHYLTFDDAPFYMPGHKRGKGIDRQLLNLLGDALFRLDLPELPDLEEPLHEAEILAAQAYGSDRTWFLTNGSTCGVQAMLLATCGQGDKILIGRNCHKSAIAGLILNGATPIYLPTAYAAEFDLDLGVTPETLEQVLTQHPDAKAVLLVSPNYFGVCSDLSQMAAIAHQFQIPLLVDAAHGAHLGFHDDLPISALQAGADLVVQSTHKMASSLTQSSMLHLRSHLVSPTAIDQALDLLRSTSPSLLLLISLDVARHQMAIAGQTMLEQTLRLSREARSQLQQIPQLRTLTSADIPNLDETRLTIMTNQTGMTGFETDTYLREQFAVTAEMPTLTQLVFSLSLGNTETDINRLIHSLQSLPKDNPAKALSKQIFQHHPTPISSSIAPRQAYFAPKTRLPLSQAIGKISAETLCPYPPGIPLICIGEEISLELIEVLRAVLRSGGIVTGAGDPHLNSVEIALV